MTIVFQDDEDHLVNAVLRLLDLERDDLERWIGLAEAHEGTLLERLGAGWGDLRPGPLPPPGADLVGPVAPGPGGRTGRLWLAAIAETPAVGFARDDTGWTWLVRWDGDAWSWLDEPPVYEEDYFEGERGAGGYVGYREEAGWRMEKAHRQVRELLAVGALEPGPVLDIGSGYGYFRAALEAAGLPHEGLEVSAHGRAVAAELFGHATYSGTLDDHADGWAQRFAAVTAFDLIEHVEDPTAFLASVREILVPGGVVAIKTPNMDAPEAEVFGPYYHSLKREHLVLFTPASLTECAGDAGLEPAQVDTTSHLLRGFVGDAECRAWAEAGRGADIVAWYRRPASPRQPQARRP